MTNLRGDAMRWIGAMLGAVLFAGTVAAGTVEIGTLVSGSAEVAGTASRSGDPVPDGALVATQDETTLLMMRNGRAVLFEPNSAARLSASGGGELELRVLSGTVRVRGRRGGAARVGAGSRVVLDQAPEPEWAWIDGPPAAADAREDRGDRRSR